MSTFAKIFNLEIILNYNTQFIIFFDRKIFLYLQFEKFSTFKNNAISLYLQFEKFSTFINNIIFEHEIISHLKYKITLFLKFKINDFLKTRIIKIRENYSINSISKIKKKLIEINFIIKRVCLNNI